MNFLAFLEELCSPPFLTGSLLAALFLVLIWTLTSLLQWMTVLDQSCKDLGSGGGYIEDPNSVSKVPLPTVFATHEKTLSVIFPAYNEALRLASTLEDTLRYLDGRAKVEPQFSYEVLVVDDGSKDETAAISYQFSKSYGVDKVRLLKQPCNQGKGAAVRKGMLCSRGALLLFADADSATRIADMEKLEVEIWNFVLKAQPLGGQVEGSRAASGMPSAADVAALKARLSDVEVLSHLRAGAEQVAAAAFGSRAHLEQQALANRKWYRNILMHGFHVAVLLAAGPGLRDTQCGFKMFTRAAARQIFTNQRLQRWCFDVEILYLCKRLRIPFAEVAVTWNEVPGSKLRPTSILHMLLELAYIRFGYGLGVWRVRRS